MIMGSPVSDSEEAEFQPSGSSVSNQHCPLNALGPGSGNFRATCDVTNKININKYFELMKEEFTTTTNSSSSKLPRSNRKTLGRSISSGKIEPLLSTNDTNNNTAPLSPRRKKNAKKRISCDENSLAIYAAHNNMPKYSETYFNYDLSGQMMKGESQHTENHHISKQKSWDLSKSKRKNWNKDKSDSELKDGHKHNDLSSSFSISDFRDLKKDNNNNDLVKSSKSCESISSLGERHKEYAMMQGKIGSVSEENRRHRRKLYRKGKKSSDEKPATTTDESLGRINHLLEKKLVIDVG